MTLTPTTTLSTRDWAASTPRATRSMPSSRQKMRSSPQAALTSRNRPSNRPGTRSSISSSSSASSWAEWSSSVSSSASCRALVLFHAAVVDDGKVLDSGDRRRDNINRSITLLPRITLLIMVNTGQSLMVPCKSNARMHLFLLTILCNLKIHQAHPPRII